MCVYVYRSIDHCERKVIFLRHFALLSTSSYSVLSLFLSIFIFSLYFHPQLVFSPCSGNYPFRPSLLVQVGDVFVLLACRL